MTAESVQSEGSADLPRRLGDWLRRARGLASQAGCPDAIDGPSSLFGMLDRPGVRVVVAGGPNSGKSRVINRYLGADVLPVSAIAGANTFTLQAAAEGEETISVEGDPSRPISESAAVLKTVPAGGGAITLRLARPRLAQHGLTLVEAPLDATEAEVPALVARLMSEGDAVVTVLDANAAMRRTDQRFLEECRVRGLPSIVAVAKVDQVPEDERGDIIDFVTGNVPDPNRTPIIPLAEGDDGIEELAVALDGMLAELDPTSVRVRQVAFALAGALDGLFATASAARELQSRNDQDRQEAVRQRRVELDRADLTWQEVQLALQRRGQKLEETLRAHLAANRLSILESLLYELERSSDIKSWWERDLPYRLQRELRGLGAQLSGTANRQIVADVRWLQEELQRRLSHPFPGSFDASLSVEAGIPEPGDQPLSDSNVLKIVSRLGAGAAVIVAGTLFATAGIGGLALASSIGAGLLAEQFIRKRTDRERAVVRGQLETLITRAELAYTEDVARKLAEGYDRILADLRVQQVRWQQEQLRALKDLADRPPDPASSAATAFEPLRALAAEVRAAIRAD